MMRCAKGQQCQQIVKKLQFKHFPKRLKIELEQVDDENWRLHYIETFGEGVPKEAFETTLKVMRSVGIPAKKRKNSAYLTVVGTRDEIFAAAMNELLGISKVGEITMRQMFELIISYRALAKLRNQTAGEGEEA